MSEAIIMCQAAEYMKQINIHEKSTAIYFYVQTHIVLWSKSKLFK